ncbi:MULTISPECIES: thiamine pyrophosphate-dependent enzyme [unclassified Oceanispirochaeta]|uniref:alpha-ketoacid dehydrogenase subunit alpha/beta n=1 Tax=unclassified Oceanispirochaeta TaxID=2635722 RepID=UPI000E08EB60|nr:MULTISPECIES: alpha-ketoacid dehydrogenase subunit alpha/beta [unclassified Oceanispirochaeta]MBF9014565.1 dehydrogenase [Oceanispirochaeta sp. M2]NPD70821.1 dehydrogenase [Oceanispirochaeta sp. M1]RDG34103.1 dehydrogenase [Oceanispirochaeta sp. M1]
MAQQITVDPKKIRKADVIKLKDIPVNQYKSNITAETKKFGKDGLKRAYYDMLIIREFETMLNNIKREGNYQGIEYNHKGPAHLAIGQESAYVGQALALDPDDFIFGSHRSHGEILAKSFKAVYDLDESKLTSTMEGFMGGDTLKVVQDHHNGESVRDTAENFVLYGALAEVFARKAGFNRGLGGSMHTFFAPFGSMPNNAIVGGSGDIALGAALFKRVNRKKGIVIANIGDGSLACGPVWEGLMMAAMDQYKTLWDKDLGGMPPYLLNVFNNFYAMGGQPVGETMGFGMAARLGAGVNPENMHAERVDGFNPLSVAEATARKKEILLKGDGPALLDTITYRQSGHSPSDASSYRSKDEMDAFAAMDCIVEFGDYLKKNKIVTQKEMDGMKEKVVNKITTTMKLAIDDSVSPRVDGQFIESVMYSMGNMPKMEEREAEVLMPLEENPRVIQLKRKARYGYDESGKKLPANKTYAFRDGIFEAMAHRFYEDPTMIAYGEDVRDWGGAFACYRGLTEALPYHRFFNSPISEASIVGSAVGYAMAGGRAVVELMYCDFLGRAGDEVFNQMPKWQSMSAGVLKMPLVLRVSVGAKYGAQHSQDWSALVAHIPGLKVMFPATPYDAKGMLNLALRGTDPVIFLESQKVYGEAELFEKDGVPEGYYEVPEGEPAVRKEGNDLTIMTIGATLYPAMDAAKVLEEKYGLSVEVIDLRFINPLNYEPLVDSLKKTGRCVLVSDATERGSFSHNVASNLTRLAFDYLDAPPVVVGSRNWISPPAEMEEIFFPQISWILDSIHEQILPLPGHTVETVQTNGDWVRRLREGV